MLLVNAPAHPSENVQKSNDSKLFVKYLLPDVTVTPTSGSGSNYHNGNTSQEMSSPETC
jgi:hypothetical protein